MSSHTCVRCGTELAPAALACPACGTLVYGDQLRQLAAQAEAASRAGDRDVERLHWQHALELLPAHAQQHAVIEARVAALTREAAASDASGSTPDGSPRRWWNRAGGVGATALLLGSKLKFLLLGLTKASTFISMFAFFAVYWSVYGWPLALGLVVSIYIHEMGHVAMLRRLGIDAGAPLFIPGVGALVMLRQHVADPLTDAMIGLAGPVWGLGAALAALVVYAIVGRPIWLVIAQLTAFINLFNLIPVWQLDGSRGMHALDRSQRWLCVGAIAVMIYLTRQPMLYIVGAVAIWRAVEKRVGPGSPRTLATFVVLIVSLSWLAGDVHTPAR